MKYILMLLIRCYWLIPKSSRRTCIFQESCSQHVYKTTQSKGLKSGLQALVIRYKQCRGGYAFVSCNDSDLVILADKTIVSRGETRL